MKSSRSVRYHLLLARRRPLRKVDINRCYRKRRKNNCS
nr:MAG TPA: hypothetical protein [Caudoviricetes sp.]